MQTLPKAMSTRSSSLPEITLYTYASSPFGSKTYFYLVYKRLKFKLVYVHPLKRQEIAFTNQALVPVLKVWDEWRVESSTHGPWLDTLFPDHPILSKDRKERLDQIDLEEEISSILMAASFRSMAQPRSFSQQVREGWNLGAIMHKTSKTPAILVPIWPFLIRRAPFLKHAACGYAPHASVEGFETLVLSEFERLLEDGPFMGGRPELSQADLTAYAAVYIANAIPLPGAPAYYSRPKLKDWIMRMEAKLPVELEPKLFSHAPDKLI